MYKRQVLSSVLSLVTQAGERLLHDRSDNVQNVQRKADGSLVCRGDLISQELITDGLRKLTPEIPVYSEEARICADLSSFKRVWVLDPLDGTNAYVDGLDSFGIMLALVSKGIPEAGWIVSPVRKWNAWGWSGGGPSTTSGIENVQRDEPRTLSGVHAMIASGDFTPEHLNKIRHVMTRLANVRGTLSCAVDYLEFLAGIHDILIYRRTLPWDHAAGIYLTTVAGAIVSRFDNSTVSWGNDKEGLVIARSRAIRSLCRQLIP